MFQGLTAEIDEVTIYKFFYWFYNRVIQLVKMFRITYLREEHRRGFENYKVYSQVNQITNSEVCELFKEYMGNFILCYSHFPLKAFLYG